MKIGLFVDPSNRETFDTLVRHADQSGIESIWTFEHVVVPVGMRFRYPYSPDGSFGPEDLPIPDPILPLAYAAAITEKLRFATGILILPQRHPAYVAKEFATLDQLSQGRAIMGVGIGWLEEEFDTVGVAFSERAARTEESVRAIRSLWRPDPEAFHGDFYRWDPVHSQPRPVQEPGVPIVVGGHVEGAARRAARVADGFFPMEMDPEKLSHLLEAMRDECGKHARNPDEVEITASPAGALDLDEVSRLADLGVSRVVGGIYSHDADDVRRQLDEIASRVISKLPAR